MGWSYNNISLQSSDIIDILITLAVLHITLITQYFEILQEFLWVQVLLLRRLCYKNLSGYISYIIFYISFPVDWICNRYSFDDTTEFHLIITFDLYLVQLFRVFAYNSQSQFWDVCKSKKERKKYNREKLERENMLWLSDSSYNLCKEI